MRVAILGAGAVALGNAAVLAKNGHSPVVWSPSGRGTEVFARGAALVTTGAIETSLTIDCATSCAEAVAGADVILVALPAYGYRTALDAVAPHVVPGQSVVISGHLSFAALYLARLLAERALCVPIVALGTTVTTGRRSGATVNIKTLRKRLDLAALPVSAGEAGLALCRTLFGDRFTLREDLLAIALSNLNPQGHMATALCNLTRMECAEAWDQDKYTTDAVGRLMEALDAERLALAAELNLSVRTVRDHFHLSFDVPKGPVGEMSRQLAARNRGLAGPTSLETRYVLEDIPFGLLVTVRIAAVLGIAVPLHEAGIAIFSALYGRDFRQENDILPSLGLDGLDPAALRRLAREGYPIAGAAASGQNG